MPHRQQPICSAAWILLTVGSTPSLDFPKRWLAHWLHDHNPRLPLVCICVEKQFEALKEMPIKKFPFY